MAGPGLRSFARRPAFNGFTLSGIQHPRADMLGDAEHPNVSLFLLSIPSVSCHDGRSSGDWGSLAELIISSCVFGSRSVRMSNLTSGVDLVVHSISLESSLMSKKSLMNVLQTLVLHAVV